MAKAEKRSVNSYEIGDKVTFARSYKRNGIEQGLEYTVVEKDALSGGYSCRMKPDR